MSKIVGKNGQVIPTILVESLGAAGESIIGDENYVEPNVTENVIDAIATGNVMAIGSEEDIFSSGALDNALSFNERLGGVFSGEREQQDRYASINKRLEREDTIGVIKDLWKDVWGNIVNNVKIVFDFFDPRRIVVKKRLRRRSKIVGSLLKKFHIYKQLRERKRYEGIWNVPMVCPVCMLDTDEPHYFDDLESLKNHFDSKHSSELGWDEKELRVKMNDKIQELKDRMTGKSAKDIKIIQDAILVIEDKLRYMDKCDGVTGGQVN